MSTTPRMAPARRATPWSALLLSVLLSARGAAGGDAYISMGAGDVLLGQPTVQIEVYTPDNPATPGNERVSYGPDLVLEFFPHTFILDTGANGLLISRDPYADLVEESNLEQMRAKGFQDALGQYREQGVAGFTDYNVSAPYALDALTDIGSGITREGVRFMSEDTQTLGDYSGIIGMPAMTGKVIRLDMTPWLLGEWGVGMETSFLDTLPPTNGVRYHVPVTLTHFPQDDTNHPFDPRPSWAPLPFVTARAATSNHIAVGNFLLDTGAQLSMLSEHMAFLMGLDSNGDEVLDSNDVGYAGSQEIGGVGGTIEAPMFTLDGLSLPTLEGPDLRWHSYTGMVYDEDLGEYVEAEIQVTVLVLEITDVMDGVLGMDLLHSGWTTAALGEPGTGAIRQACFDFSAPTGDAAALVIDLSPDWSEVQTNHVPDRDGDSLPDEWELAHFGTTFLASSAPDSDQDYDGFSDACEYRADTDPMDPGSRLEVATLAPGGSGDLKVVWPAVTGRLYRVEISTNGLDYAGPAFVPGVAGIMTSTVPVGPVHSLVRVTADAPGP